MPALATITEVLPLPAAAMTRLRSSSITTALRCSSVRGLASIWSNRVRDRTSSVATNASLARDRISSGASRSALDVSQRSDFGSIVRENQASVPQDSRSLSVHSARARRRSPHPRTSGDPQVLSAVPVAAAASRSAMRARGATTRPLSSPLLSTACGLRSEAARTRRPFLPHGGFAGESSATPPLFRPPGCHPGGSRKCAIQG